MPLSCCSPQYRNPSEPFKIPNACRKILIRLRGLDNRVCPGWDKEFEEVSGKRKRPVETRQAQPKRDLDVIDISSSDTEVDVRVSGAQKTSLKRLKTEPGFHTGTNENERRNFTRTTIMTPKKHTTPTVVTTSSISSTTTMTVMILLVMNHPLPPATAKSFVPAIPTFRLTSSLLSIPTTPPSTSHGITPPPMYSGPARRQFRQKIRGVKASG